ncbi:putative UDP-GlcNAc: N-acetylglucosaminyltransferase [Penicillium oxalicum 114-2]|uniref:Putative UDP-GlcNAc: N-acetylglucosaminyltransferase n=1 Tax=Penicillium oxalicum (strain 114-2 / CGMCC 5302) TaxID=933388 RepID=S8ATK2_PENO1|nr:putative UDP-GlcNAc: N-acetylglucosaminyltransferase [Penicillium oxalicum 114-2]
MAFKNSAFPYRRGSNSSERDFFDIPDEPIWAILKRQLRRPRAWVALLGLLALVQWMRRAQPSPVPLAHIHYDEVDWSRYAYTQYATSETYLCNCVMVFEALHRLGSRADRLLFYPKEWDLVVDGGTDRISQLLLLAKDEYNVQLVPVVIEGIKAETGGGGEVSESSWDTSTAKLYAFGVLQYDRVIHLDSDMMLLQPMDELFFLPSTTIAMPRAYWLLPETRTLSSLLAVIEPSYQEFTLLKDTIQPAIFGQIDLNLTYRRYDMEILNNRYGDSALVLPHRQYGLISGEFRTKDHRAFLGNDHEQWDPDHAIAQAKFVHFSDWPLPKPWVMWTREQLITHQPACDNGAGTSRESGCRNREIWKQLYEQFRRRRRDVCRLLSFPAPV